MKRDQFTGREAAMVCMEDGWQSGAICSNNLPLAPISPDFLKSWLQQFRSKHQGQLGTLTGHHLRPLWWLNAALAIEAGFFLGRPLAFWQFLELYCWPSRLIPDWKLSWLKGKLNLGGLRRKRGWISEKSRVEEPEENLMKNRLQNTVFKCRKSWSSWELRHTYQGVLAYIIHEVCDYSHLHLWYTHYIVLMSDRRESCMGRTNICNDIYRYFHDFWKKGVTSQSILGDSSPIKWTQKTWFFWTYISSTNPHLAQKRMWMK